VTIVVETYPDIVEVETRPEVVTVVVADTGQPGPPGGPTVIAVPYDQWPPANPQPDILYLRLAP